MESAPYRGMCGNGRPHKQAQQKPQQCVNQDSSKYCLIEEHPSVELFLLEVSVFQNLPIKAPTCHPAAESQKSSGAQSGRSIMKAWMSSTAHQGNFIFLRVCIDS
mmetsp:Transcript_128874/g.241030  ORF Transcript_128874/g.241030 Transcript_128874/m.241030 type:complete len:105 (-) Transcript_128874:578-892(-)